MSEHFEEESISVRVSEEDADKRLDVVLSAAFKELSRSRIAKLLEEGRVILAGSSGKKPKPGNKVRAGEEYLVLLPPPELTEAEPEDIPLDILYEDSDVIVVNKPKGMVVHPDNVHKSGTLVNALLFHCTDLSGIGGELRPGIVHRIDMDTTGSVIACKNDEAHASLSEQLREHTIERRYIALVIGKLKDAEGRIDKPIGRSERDRKKMAVEMRPGRGRRAVTDYRVMEELEGFSLVECRLHTGRTHQIRVHMASIGHPILGDELYGNPGINKKYKNLHGQCLHAQVLEFTHPTTQERIRTFAPLPDYFESLLAQLRQ